MSQSPFKILIQPSLLGGIFYSIDYLLTQYPDIIHIAGFFIIGSVITYLTSLSLHFIQFLLSKTKLKKLVEYSNLKAAIFLTLALSCYALSRHPSLIDKQLDDETLHCLLLKPPPLQYLLVLPPNLHTQLQI